MGWKTTSDQSNGGPDKYSDMRLGVISRSKVTTKLVSKLEAEYNKLSPKQKQSFWRTNSIISS